MAAYEHLKPVQFSPPSTMDIWSARDEVCSRARAEGRGDAVLRAVHAVLPTSIEGLSCFAFFVADRGEGSFEPHRASALTPVSVTHLVELAKLLGLEHLADVASFLWFGDEAAFTRLQPVARARAEAFTGRLGGVSRGDGEARAFALFAAAFSDEAAALRHVAKSTGDMAGGRGMCSAAAAWLAQRHGLTLPAAPEADSWDGGVFEKAVAVGRLLNAIDQAHPALLAEVAAPLLESVWYGGRIALAARLFGRWDAAFVVSNGDSFLEAASRGGVVYSRSGKTGKDGKVSVKLADPKKARAEVEKKVAAKEKEWGATRAAL